MSDLQMIVCVDEAGGFAKGGEIPWNYKEDWEHFKKVTKGAICIMGRHTYNDIQDRKPKSSKSKKLLAGRDSYVITSSTDEESFKGVEGISTSIRQIMDKLPDDDTRNVFVLGGEKIYIQYIVHASRVWVTIVPGMYDCDRKFPVQYLRQHFLISEGSKETTKDKEELLFVKYDRKLR